MTKILIWLQEYRYCCCVCIRHDCKWQQKRIISFKNSGCTAENIVSNNEAVKRMLEASFRTWWFHGNQLVEVDKKIVKKELNDLKWNTGLNVAQGADDS